MDRDVCNRIGWHAMGQLEMRHSPRDKGKCWLADVVCNPALRTREVRLAALTLTNRVQGGKIRMVLTARCGAKTAMRDRDDGNLNCWPSSAHSHLQHQRRKL